MTAETGVPAVDTVLVWGGAASLLAGVVAVGWRLARGLVRFGRRVDQFIDDWQGEEARPGVPGRPGVMERMGGLEDRMGVLEDGFARVSHELYPNSGESLRDAVDLANRRLALLCPDDTGPGPGTPVPAGDTRGDNRPPAGDGGGDIRGVTSEDTAGDTAGDSGGQ